MKQSRQRSRRLRASSAVLLALALHACASAPRRPRPPPAGSLLIVGGGPIPDAILERFVALAGGPGRARIVIYPMASEDRRGRRARRGLPQARRRAERVVLTREQADTEAAARRLDGVTGIWFGGGDQAQLTAALWSHPRRGRDPPALPGGRRRRRDLRRRRRDVHADDHRRRAQARRQPPARQGFERRLHDDRARGRRDDGRVRHAAGRHRRPALRPAPARTTGCISLVLENPELVGIGIDESTALEVGPGGPWRVLGESAAVVSTRGRRKSRRPRRRSSARPG